MSTPTHDKNVLLLPDSLDWDMSLIEANIEVYLKEARILAGSHGDEEDHQQVKPGVGNTVRSAWWDAIEYVGQKLTGIFGRS
jgi:hypothetical protein